MKYLAALCLVAIVAGPFCFSATAQKPALSADAAAGKNAGHVYGEWRIRVRPDKGNEYAKLIETQGLPLFRSAGGRMVGWWTTAVGDLYEQVTIWEYDGMAAFEAAGEKLGSDKNFAAFVAARDPLLTGEENRFLQLADFARRPGLPEPAKVVIHEVHRVPLSRREPYMRYMQSEGLALLERSGFRPAGPWTVAIGNWNEVTYLFRFDSLREREELIARFAGTADAKEYGRRIGELTDEITTRVLVPAKFAHATNSARPQ